MIQTDLLAGTYVGNQDSRALNPSQNRVRHQDKIDFDQLSLLAALEGNKKAEGITNQSTKGQNTAAETSGEQNKATKKPDEMSSQEALEYLQSKCKEMKDKLMNGETEDKIQIGALECTSTEWKTLLKKIDRILDDVKEKMEKDQEKREEKQLKKDTEEKKEIEISMIQAKPETFHDPVVPQFLQIF